MERSDRVHPTRGGQQAPAFWRWLCAWLLLALGGTLLHYLVWNPSLIDGSAAPVSHESFVKLADNAVQLAILPAWAIVWKVLGRFQDIPATVIANLLGWGMWVVVIHRIVRRVRGSGRPDGQQTAGAKQSAVRGIDVGRRKFLAGAALGAGGGAGSVAFGVGALVTPWSIRTARYTVEIADLPQELDGFRIVQVSDTHLGPRIPRRHIRRALEAAAALKPDLLALTGDYVHMGDWYISPAVEMFAEHVSRRSAPSGVVAVLGNHDHYGDAPRTIKELKAAGIRVLDNDRCFISATRRMSNGLAEGEAGLCIAGVGDLLEGVVDAHAALNGVPPRTPCVMLAHNPDSSEYIAAMTREKQVRVDLMLSGHTHGGQIALPGYGPIVVPSDYGRRFAHGLVATSLCPMIVSAGVGMSIMPLRLGVPPEIVEITLVRRRQGGEGGQTPSRNP